MREDPGRRDRGRSTASRPGIPTRSRLAAAFFLTVLLCLPTTALANAGTPLMWAAPIHLILGNAIIGVLEGLTLAVLKDVESDQTAESDEQ